MSVWMTAYNSRDDLLAFGDNALGLFSLTLKFGIEEIASLGNEIITDGYHDKKCDLVFTNIEERYAVVGQCYFSQKPKDCAPANKASDLNTAVTWILQRDLADLPTIIRSAASQLRQAIHDKKIDHIYIWYIHNCNENQQVKDELKTVHMTLNNILSNSYSDYFKGSISVQEVGDETLSTWYESSMTPILVNDIFTYKIDGGYEVVGPKWKAYSTAIYANNLRQSYKKHESKIFSANVRDYLGSKDSDSNINNGIKETVTNNPENFWVFNNGLTILTHSYEIKGKTIIFRGFSIVNGAQTTGALGNTSKAIDPNAKVQARFVCITDSDTDLIHEIIKYNNSQNKIEASDFRSTDPIQKKLKKMFTLIPNTEYEGGRRGGVSDLIRRRPNLLPSLAVGQALACFHGDPVTGYNKKTGIWKEDALYSKFFNEETTASHIVCTYALYKAIEKYKKNLMDKFKKDNLNPSEVEYLEFFRMRGSIAFFTSAIAGCIETITNKTVTSIFNISFDNTISVNNAEEIWMDIIEVMIPFCPQMAPVLSDGGLNNKDNVQKHIKLFVSFIRSTVIPNQHAYAKFSKLIKV